MLDVRINFNILGTRSSVKSITESKDQLRVIFASVWTTMFWVRMDQKRKRVDVSYLISDALYDE